MSSPRTLAARPGTRWASSGGRGVRTCFQAVSPEECLSVSGQGLGAVGMRAGVWVCSRTSPGGGPLLTETYPGRLGPHQSGSVTVFAAGTFVPIPNQMLAGFNFPLHPLQVEACCGHGGSRRPLPGSCCCSGQAGSSDRLSASHWQSSPSRSQPHRWPRQSLQLLWWLRGRAHWSLCGHGSAGSSRPPPATP